MVMFNHQSLNTKEKSANNLDKRQRSIAVRQIRNQILGRLPSGEFQIHRTFHSVPAFAIEIGERGLQRLLEDSRIMRIDLDVGGEGHLAEAVPLAEVDDFRVLGFTGQGVTVAVLDSGYDSDHLDLSDDLVAESCFCNDGNSNQTGCCPNGLRTQFGNGAAEDDNGHGTNVTGIITSKGDITPLGVAPNAKIVAVKVLDEHNQTCCSSDVVAALDWVLSERPDVDLVNMSLGTFALYPGGHCDETNAVSMAYADVIDGLRDRGVAVFASSGNQGSGSKLPLPACIANSIAVGAVWDANLGSQAHAGCIDQTTAPDQVTCFSNTNSATDLFAPGAYTSSTGVGGSGATHGGTSQASPLSAGCAALLLDKAPRTTPDRLEERLKASPVSVTDATNGRSFPRLDCFSAGTPCSSPTTLILSTQQIVLDTEEEVACERLEAGPYTVGSSGDVTFRAGKTIVLGGGFLVTSGGKFRAAIDGLLMPPAP